MTGWPPPFRPLPLRLGGISIQFQLLAAFLIVALIPMLVSAWVATRVVSDAFEQNVEKWLRESASFFLSSLQETRDEALVVSRYLLADPAMMHELVTGHSVPPPALQRLVASLGYDLVAIYDLDKRIVYSSQPVDGIELVPVRNDNSIYHVTTPNRSGFMTAGVRRFELTEGSFFLLLGSWLDQEFIANFQSLSSLELRIFYNDKDHFREIYSSQREPKERRPLPDGVVQALQEGEDGVYDPDADGGAYRAFYTGMRSANGDLVGVVFCGLRGDESLSGLINSTNLFIFIFLVGTALSSGAALVLTRWLVRPIRALASGVRAVEAGDFGRRVAVLTRDELGELAGAFNQMTGRLQQLHEIEAQLRRRDRLSAIGEVALGIAHEVRNPLGIIKTSTELLLRRPESSPQDSKLLNYVNEEVRRIDALISEFLALAKPAPPAMREIEPKAVLERVAEFCEPELSRRNVTLELIDRAPGEFVQGDDNQLFQAALNLIINALEAMEKDGRINLTLEPAGTELAMRFADTGPGIPADLKERIFNPFFTTKVRGTGLGLAKVFAVMESHGGRVECISEPGHGAVFTLYLPRLGRETRA